jgi:hypothetical protein
MTASSMFSPAWGHQKNLHDPSSTTAHHHTPHPSSCGSLYLKHLQRKKSNSFSSPIAKVMVHTPTTKHRLTEKHYKFI